MNLLKHTRVKDLVAIVLLAPGANYAAAQPSHTHAAQATSMATESKYGDQQTRVIKALPPQETRDFPHGKALGSAKAAEFNGYPGAMHTLEHEMK